MCSASFALHTLFSVKRLIFFRDCHNQGSLQEGCGFFAFWGVFLGGMFGVLLVGLAFVCVGSDILGVFFCLFVFTIRAIIKT